MFFYGLFNQDLEGCNAMYPSDLAALNACQTVRNTESQAVRAGVALGIAVGALGMYLYKRKG
jgi:hypothetical protein